MLINRVLLVLNIAFICVFISMIMALASDPVFVKKIEIPVGKEESQMQWVNFEKNDWRVTIKAFLVGNSDELYLNEPRSGLIKVFNSSGKYLRSFLDYGIYPIFLYEENLYGTKRRDERSVKELVIFSANDGALLHQEKLPFEGRPWFAYEIEDGKLYFALESLRKNQFRYFDMQKKIFGAHSGFKQYESEDLNNTSSKYLELGFEKIGRIADFLLFRSANCESDKNSCRYQIIAVTEKNKGLTDYEFTINEADIGYYMPDVPWVLVKKRYLYTIGYPRTGTRPSNKIIVTCIDLQKVFPKIFQEK